MSLPTPAKFRVNLTRSNISCLRDEWTSWFAQIRAADEDGRHHSRLEALEKILHKAAGTLSEHASTLPAVAPWQPCTTTDDRTLWLRKVWDFFREKLDQRRGPAKALLDAADEVCWSCFGPPLARAAGWSRNVAKRPPPLPYLDASFYPATLPNERIPRGLMRDHDRAFLDEHLGTIPIPVLRLPAACLAAPWWLVLIGHECGHQIQYALGPEGRLVTDIEDSVRALVLRETGDDGRAEDWAAWSQELFADLWSICTMGPSAIDAMRLLEWHTTDTMNRARRRYPAPRVRLAFMAEVWRIWLARAGEPVPESAELLPGIANPEAPALPADTQTDLALVRPMAEHLLGPLPGFEFDLFKLSGREPLDFQDGGQVDLWNHDLRRGKQPFATTAPAAAFMAAAVFRFWFQEPRPAPDAPDTETAELRLQRCLNSITACSPPGTRGPVEPELPDLGKALLENPLPETEP
ncbi:hypothetical protein SCOR_30695 [Sulfidibacter corallicola]|uniref:Uncharacterized protein n=1 Tax=Sulfidibacter corallicola TaxID=2818388 RepID=A0A8A4TU67_SULCO|nr:hypothetical protein [Sulfidibacter corallicola]QTD50075.1 hypothetical protein J3U87_31205 [Sulfidibacter corallicola]